jgi:hypothetical protein
VNDASIQAKEHDTDTDDILFQARQALRALSTPIASPKVQSVSKPSTLSWKPVGPAPEVVDAAKTMASRPANSPTIYAMLCLLLIIFGMALVRNSNQSFGPEMYAENGLVPAADAFTHGENYAVFDLNLNIRRLRDLYVARLTKTPDLIVLGASQWQEANHSLVKGMTYYNSHVHRDYWQDMLGVSEILARNKRLPKRMIISLRDNIFTPISKRSDYLWETGIPYYRDMADRLGVEKESYWTSLPYQRMKQLLSISMLFDNLTRWYNASERPHATTEYQFDSLDTLLSDGSIVWSRNHLKLFTQERSKREALSFADRRLNDPPQVEARGVDAIDKLLTFLKSQGVTVYLAQTPFNPIFYDHVQGSAYAEGLTKVDALVHDIAKRHGLRVIGGYNPHKVGCVASMYIDAEHANASCLKNLFDQFMALDRARAGQ